MEFRDLEAQYLTLKPAIDEAVGRVLASGRFIGGAEVATLESTLADYVGVSHCVTCANGTDALLLALMAWGIGPGDAVIVPDFTFFSTGEVVSALGAMPVFVPVDSRTFNIDPATIAPAIGAARDAGLRPRVVIAVDLFGLPADYPVLESLCREEGLLLLEDGAQGFGGSIDRTCFGDTASTADDTADVRRACSFGDIATTSFFPAKPLGCYGDGGALFTNDDEWAALVRSLAVHGKGSSKYDNVRIGMNSRLDALQAAILQVKFEALATSELQAVDDAAAAYDQALASCDLVLPLIPDGYRSAWAQYTIQLPPSQDRSMLIEALREAGIPSMVYYPAPMHCQTAFQGAMIDLAGQATADLCNRVLSLPMGPTLTSGDIAAVAAVIGERVPQK